MSAAAPASKRWLFGPAPDLLFGCGVGYMLLFGVLFAWGDVYRNLPGYLAPLLILLFAAPHYGATLLRVYEQRRERRRYALFSVWATLLIFAWFVAAQHLAVLGSLMLTLYLSWSPWHYTGQNYGIALMLAGRRGVRVDPTTKRWLHASFALAFLSTLAVLHESEVWAQSRHLPLHGAEIRFLPLGTPQWLAVPAVAAWAVATAGAALRLLRRAPVRDLAPPLLLVVSQFLWFVLPAQALHWGLFSGREPLGADVQIYALHWIALAHSLQYLWVTAYYARASETWRGGLSYAAKVFVAGLALWTLPTVVFASHWLGGVAYETGLAFLVGAAINIHHFVLDGAIWKLRDGPIARVLIRDEAEAPPAPAPIGPSWGRPTVWALSAACAVLGVMVFAAENLVVPRQIARGERAGAAAWLDALAWVGRDSSRLRAQLAGRAAVAGEHEEALRQLQRSHELRPSLDVLGGIVETQVWLGRIDDALASCERLLLAGPDDPRVLRLVGELYRRTGRADEGRRLLERAVVLADAGAGAGGASLKPALY